CPLATLDWSRLVRLALVRKRDNAIEHRRPLVARDTSGLDHGLVFPGRLRLGATLRPGAAAAGGSGPALARYAVARDFSGATTHQPLDRLGSAPQTSEEIMRFWIRELLGWGLMALGLVMFFQAYAMLGQRMVWEAGQWSVIGFVVFRGGIH